jgi:hypothetical protein
MKAWFILALISIAITPLSNGETLINLTERYIGDPSYALEIETSNNKLNPGDDFEMDLRVSGAGSVDASKIRVSIPFYIVQNSKIDTHTLRYKNNSETYTDDWSTGTATSFFIMPPNEYFKNRNDSFASFGEIYNSIGGKKRGPISIKFTLRDDAPRGDQNIYTILYYKHDDKWYIDKQVVPIHNKYWYEGDRLQYLALLALAGGLIVTIIELIKFGYFFGEIRRKKKAEKSN